MVNHFKGKVPVLITCLITLLGAYHLKSQNHLLDSLLLAQKNKLVDSVRVDLYQNIAGQYSQTGNDTAVYFAQKAISLATKIKDNKRISNSHSFICNYYSGKTKFSEAYNSLVTYENFTEKSKDTLLIINSLASRAILYRQLNQLDKVIEVERKKAELYHLIKDTLNEAKEYYVIGWTGYNAKFFKEAVIDLHKGRVLCTQLNELHIRHKIYNWLGASYNGLKQFDSALYYAKIVMNFNVEQKNLFTIAESYRYTGDIYYNMKRFDTALTYYNNAIDYYIKSNSVGRSFLLRTYKVRTLDSLKRYKEAAKELDYVREKADKNDGLVQTYINWIGKDLYVLTGEPYKAVECYRKYDSVFKNSQTDEAQQQILVAEFKKEQEKEKALQEAEKKEKDALFELENHKQKNIRNILIAGFLIVLVIGAFIFMSLRRNKKTNKIISLQKNELEEKNKSIIDSINYAKRIQYTLLAHDEFLSEYLSDYFIYFNPKDIVSGDFYWATKKENKFYLAVCDSTGHGVPGAFMSLLNISFLNEAITERNILEPHEILNYARQKLIDNISKEEQKDGFDGVVMCFEYSTDGKQVTKVTYAAGNNSPLLISKGNIVELYHDRMPIGIGERKESFKLNTIDVNKGDTIYLFTDGYADQFGGPKGKKFKYKPLNELLVANTQLPLTTQKVIIENTFNEWRGNHEQVDDVCLIGIKI